MAATIINRQPRLKEARACAEFIAFVREHTYSLEPESPAYDHMVREVASDAGIAALHDKFVRSLQTNLQFARVAVLLGNIVGVALARREANVVVVENVSVAPELQGRGIGSNFLGQAHAWADSDCKLWALERNAGAITFYEHHGYEPFGLEIDPNVGVTYLGMIRRMGTFVQPYTGTDNGEIG